MPEFYIADVRKRANPDFNLSPQAIPEARSFPNEPAAEEPGAKDYERLLKVFGGDEIPDDPVACGLPGCEDVTMEWTSGSSFGQIDFYGGGGEDPQRFLSLYIFSGNDPAQDRAGMKQLGQYADFAQCLNFPLVVQVTSDPLTAQWQHDALQAMRKGMGPLVAAFLKGYFSAAKTSDAA